MFAKPCYRTLDRPLSILGLEPGDLVLVVLAALVVFLFVGQILGLALGFGLGFGLRKLKEGKPPGYLYALAYRYGLLRLLPAALRVPHLVQPPLPWEPPVIRLSAFHGESDRDRPEVRFYHGPKPRLD